MRRGVGVKEKPNQVQGSNDAGRDQTRPILVSYNQFSEIYLNCNSVIPRLAVYEDLFTICCDPEIFYFVYINEIRGKSINRGAYSPIY